jgi:hypothetical protein
MTRRHFRRLLTAAGAAALLIPGLAGTGLATSAPHGTISTVIGGPGGPAPATSVSVWPCTLKYAPGGLYFSSYGSVVDRVSERTGLLTPIAGNGLLGINNAPGPRDGTPALAGTLGGACGVTTDGAGNVLIAGSVQVLVVAAKTGTFYGRRMTAGRVYAVASGWAGGLSGDTADVQLDSAGNLVIAVAGTPGADGPDGDSRVFVYAEHNGTFFGRKMAAGHLYRIAGLLDGAAVGNAVPATQADLGVYIGNVQLDPAGNVVVADQGGNGGFASTGVAVPPLVRVIASRTGTFYGLRMKAGYIYTIAGGGGKAGDGVRATGAPLTSASGVALDHAGNVLVADASLRVIAVKSGVFYGRKMTAGDIYTVPGLGATGVAVDAAGNVLAVTSPGVVQMLAEKTGSYYGKSRRAGHLYTIAGNGQVRESGDGGPATSAELSPAAVATLRSVQQTAVAESEWVGTVRVVAGQAGTFFGRPMRAGFIYTVAKLPHPGSVAYDQDGNLLISDEQSNRVRVVACRTGFFYGQQMTAGRTYTAVGGGTKSLESGAPARDVQLTGLSVVATDSAGDVLIGTSSNAFGAHQVWMMAARTGTRYGQAMTAGDLYPVAGDGTSGQAGDGGPATAAEIESPGLTADGSGNLVLADTNRVRVVADTTGTFYGQQMTAGDIYTVAGGGTRSGDGAPALQASLGSDISQVAVDPTGNVLAGGRGTIFLLAERTASFFGKAAHAGDVYTVALSRDTGLLGDGGSAVGAMFIAAGIAIVPQTGNLLIADIGRVRSVSR